MWYRAPGGFTVAEILVVLAVAALLAALAARPAARLLDGIKMKNAVNAIRQVTLSARSQAVANPRLHCGVVYRVNAGPGPDSVWSFLDRSVPPNNVYDPGVDTRYQAPYVLDSKDKVEIAWANPATVVFRGDGSAYRSAKVAIRLGSRVDTLDILASTGRVRVIRP